MAADLEELERLARACCATYVAGDRLAIYKSATASEDFKAALPQYQVPRLLLSLLEERKRLRTALERIATGPGDSISGHLPAAQCRHVARAALEGEKP